MLLGVNIDHIATIRQARYAGMHQSHNAEPSPLQAALDSIEGGADSITIHVRGDRRHMQDSDAFEIREKVSAPLNLEMGITGEMLGLALILKPDFACLVPENREEITTEGGLDVHGSPAKTRDAVARLRDAGIRVSLFIDPDISQIEAAVATGAEMIELHTGAFANALGAEADAELARLAEGAAAGHAAGLQVNAGHGINYSNITSILTLPHITELNIGHSIIARATRVGLVRAVCEMKELMP
ncbi:MAG: pyridoxine 5'-phosphate synthase [Luteolibacter sp.]|jgi:pyridoxine 5-phosphate synthase